VSVAEPPTAIEVVEGESESPPTTVTGMVLLVVPSEIETVVWPPVAPLTVNDPVEAPDRVDGEMLTMPVGELDAVNVPVKLVSLAFAVNDVVPPETLIVCVPLGVTVSDPACTVIVAVNFWL
jgi:hypothetical protein